MRMYKGFFISIFIKKLKQYPKNELLTAKM